MCGQMRSDGTNSVVSEQWVQLKARADGREGVKPRHTRVELDTPTLARLYPQRWTIERGFLHLTVQLRCAPRTVPRSRPS